MNSLPWNLQKSVAVVLGTLVATLKFFACLPAFILTASLSTELVAFQNHGSQIVEQVRRAIWKITAVDGNSRVSGTAFLFDPRGYFLTASHVVKSGPGDYFRNIRAWYTSDPSIVFEVTPMKETDLCSEVGRKQQCTSGFDIIILKATNFPEGKFACINVDFNQSLLRQSFDGMILGYPADAIGLVSIGIGTFNPVSIDKRGTFFETGLSISPGHSGGPVVSETQPPSAMGVASWGQFPITDDFPSKYSYFAPTVDAHDIIRSLEPETSVKLVAEQIATNTIDPVELRENKLQTMSNVQLVHLVKELPRDSSQGITRIKISKKMAQVLYYTCFRKGLPEESAEIANGRKGKFPEIGMLREVARAKIVLADELERQEKRTEAKRTRAEALPLYVSFLTSDTLPSLNWVGRNVVAATTFDVGVTYAKLGDGDNSSSWTAASFVAKETPAASAALADHYFRTGDYAFSALLYANAYQQGLKKRFVVNGYGVAMKKSVATQMFDSTTVVLKGKAIGEVPITMKSRSEMRQRTSLLLGAEPSRVIHTTLDANRRDN